MDYRVYLLDADHHIRAAEHFPAECDEEAMEIASVSYDACSDAFAACKV